MTPKFAAQFANDRRRDWIASLVVGAVISILISIVFWYGETHSETGAIAALTSCLVGAGMVDIIVGTMVGIIASGIPHSGNMSIMIVAATCVNCGLYAIVIYAIVRAFRAVAGHLSTNKVVGKRT